ncbi:hypothetical protein THRCLA_22617 [Thraustotheca clavata]|uniref:Uncharacterized protein n=1 Tax=Thraustotheca clavata TaxID=74557 RepID=A0A1V9YW02_9STRA|nr:hypothetical protein THRCLA_22617 [Thraustotheca clavata]
MIYMSKKWAAISDWPTEKIEEKLAEKVYLIYNYLSSIWIMGRIISFYCICAYYVLCLIRPRFAQYLKECKLLEECKPLALQKEVQWERYENHQKIIMLSSMPESKRNLPIICKTLKALDISVQIYFNEVDQGIKPDEFFNAVNHTIAGIAKIPSSFEASTLIGKLTTLNLHARDSHQQANAAMKTWCSLALNLLPEYLNQLQAQESINCSTLSDTLFKQGYEDMEKISTNLLNCQKQLQLLTMEIAKLVKFINKRPVVGLIENNNHCCGFRVRQANTTHRAICSYGPKSQEVYNLINLVQQIKVVIFKLYQGLLKLMKTRVIDMLNTEVSHPSGWHPVNEASKAEICQIVKKLVSTCSRHQLH